MEELKLILDYLIVPLILWCVYVDRKIVKLESQKITSQDLEKLYNELKEIRNDIHSGFVSKEACSFRHD